MKVGMDDGTGVEGAPGDTAVIPPGHHTCIGEDEPYTSIDFANMKDF